MKPPSGDNERFLSRWSRLKRAGVQPAAGGESAATAAVSTPGTTPAVSAAKSAAPPDAKSQSPAARAASEVEAVVASLPPVESLTIESDFAQFFQPKVPDALRRAAVKKLFADPHFNIMDGLDTYIDDYSKPDPIPPEMLRKIKHARGLLGFDEEDAKIAKEAADAKDSADAADAKDAAEAEDAKGAEDAQNATDVSAEVDETQPASRPDESRDPFADRQGTSDKQGPDEQTSGSRLSPGRHDKPVPAPVTSPRPPDNP